MTAAPVIAKTLTLQFVISSGPGAGKTFSFDKPIVTIGRGPENDLILSDDPKISRAHVEVRTHLGQVIVRNISQRNAIQINGERVIEKTISKSSASMQIGDTVLQLKVEASAAPSPSPALSPAPSPLVLGGEKTVVQKSSRPVMQPAADPLPPPPPPPRAPRGQDFSRSVSGGQNSRLRFYLIIAVVGAAGYWLFSGSAEKKAETQLRTDATVARAVEESAQVVQELTKELTSAGQGTVQYQVAQENYVKGFRDYRQGQYARAMESFGAALNAYPNHELAKKYLLESSKKFEQRIDFEMAQGRKYKEKQNWRMCQGSFGSVLAMVKDPNKLKYKEAKANYDECNLRIQGKY